MNHFKKLFLALGLLATLAAAALVAPNAAAGGRAIMVQCGSEVRSCPGTSNGSGGCVYSEKCLTCQ